jgi:hypothetical protein
VAGRGRRSPRTRGDRARRRGRLRGPGPTQRHAAHLDRRRTMCPAPPAASARRHGRRSPRRLRQHLRLRGGPRHRASRRRRPARHRHVRSRGSERRARRRPGRPRGRRRWTADAAHGLPR